MNIQLINPFILKCKRKHLLIDQDYYLYLLEDSILLCQTQNASQSKYRIALDLSTLFHFLMKDSDIQAFGFQLPGKFKWFHAKHEDLLNLKSQLGNKVMFSHILDFYLPGKIIGSGVSSQVFMIQDKVNKQEFASKCIPKTQLEDDLKTNQQIQVATLHTEIQILRKLQHPSILKVYDVFEGQSTYYIILELLKGPTLGRLIRQQTEPFEISDIRKIFTRILEAVAYIHENDIIHRDLKPENIMFKESYNYDSIKIIDFGFSTECNVKSYLYPKCGTPGYVAPEIINLKDLTLKYSNKCDLFSCGVILYKLFTRQNLFPGSNTEAILKLNRKCYLNLSLLTLYRVPKDACDLIVKLLQPDPLVRISAQDALKHPFITQIELIDQNFNKSLELNTFMESSFQFLDDQVKPQKLPESNKPYFKITSQGYGSFVMKQHQDSMEQNVYSPPALKLTVSDTQQGRMNSFKLIKSEGGENKQKQFIYFPIKQKQSFSTQNFLYQFNKRFQKLKKMRNDSILNHPIQQSYESQLIQNLFIIKMSLLPGDDKHQIDIFIQEYQYFAPQYLDLQELKLDTQGKLRKNFDGSIYYGYLVNGKKHNKGILVKGQKIYCGQWQNDLRHGIGKETYSPDQSYDGQYVNGNLQGIGTYTWDDGSFYKGSWNSGVRHGQGTWQSGNQSYSGEWHNGNADGQGIQISQNGDKYEGEFQKGLKHGTGREEFSNGDLYEGDYANGRPQGVGLYVWAKGSQYEGEFKNGLRHGSGLWLENNQPEQAGAQYKGKYVNDKKCGAGIYTWKSGNYYQGDFFDDKRHGMGEMFWIDNTYYKGSWQKGVQNGDGQLFTLKHGTQHGVFINNKLSQDKFDQFADDRPQNYKLPHSFRNESSREPSIIGIQKSTQTYETINRQDDDDNLNFNHLRIAKIKKRTIETSDQQTRVLLTQSQLSKLIEDSKYFQSQIGQENGDIQKYLIKNNIHLHSMKMNEPKSKSVANRIAKQNYYKNNISCDSDTNNMTNKFRISIPKVIYSRRQLPLQF